MVGYPCLEYPAIQQEFDVAEAIMGLRISRCVLALLLLGRMRLE